MCARAWRERLIPQEREREEGRKGAQPAPVHTMALENSLGFVITLVICVLCIAFETQALVLVVPSLISHFESFIALAGLSDMLPRIAAAPCGLVQQFTMGCPEKSDKYDTSRLEVILVYAAFWLILTSLTNKIVGLFSSGSAPSSSKPLLRALGNLVSASLQGTTRCVHAHAAPAAWVILKPVCMCFAVEHVYT